MQNNVANYAAQELAARMASMAIQMGALRQQNDELSQANQILKDQLKKKEGNANDAANSATDDGQTDDQPAEATPAAK